jgi:tetratricopeptide (TPR) repeat protein
LFGSRVAVAAAALAAVFLQGGPTMASAPSSQRTTASFVSDYAAWVRGGARSEFDLTAVDLDVLRGDLARLNPTQLPVRQGATADETRESQRRLVTSVALETAAVGAKRHAAAAGRLIEWACQYVRAHTPVNDFDRAWELAALAALEGAIDSDGLRAHLGHLHSVLADDPRVQLAYGIADEQVTAPTEVLTRSLAVIDLAHAEQRVARTDGDAGRAAERAIARYQDALNTPAIHTEAVLRLGHVYLMQHRDDQALTAWKEIGDDSPNDPALVYLARLFRGLAYEDLKRDDDARAAYQAAADLSPSAQSVNVRLALLAYRSGRTQESQEIVERLLQQYDPRTDPWWSYYAADWRFWYPRIRQVRGLLN